MDPLQKEILALKKAKKALILAHYYQPLAIQEIADQVGDSFELARLAKVAEENLLIVCGVRFMAENAKILSPQKTVLLPAPEAGCPMVDMVGVEDVLRLRRQYPEAAVVSYVNSSAAVKAVSDICCTSSSAARIVRSLPQKQIIFIPDRNLGAYIAKKTPEKELILYQGFCPTHNRVTEEDVLAAKAAHPLALVLAHPECSPEVLSHADYIGSTSAIIAAAESSDKAEFIIGTEIGVADRLQALYPDKRFYPLIDTFICPNMKKNSLNDVLKALEQNIYEITLDPEEIRAASRSLERMIAVK